MRVVPAAGRKRSYPFRFISAEIALLAALAVSSSLGAVSANAEPETTKIGTIEPRGQNSITRMYLIDADADVRIRELHAGDTLNLFQLPTRNLSIEAETTEDVSKVLFRLNNQHRFRSETSRPFSLAGDTAGKFHAWKPAPGRYLIETTPFVGESPGIVARVEFEIVDEPGPAAAGVKPTNPEELDVVEVDRSNASDSPYADAASRAKLADEAVSPGEAAAEPEVQADALKVTNETNNEQSAALDDEHKNAAPVAPLPQYKLLSDSDYPDTRCVGFVSKETEHLMVVCAHRFVDIESAQLVLNPADGAGKKICEFLNTQSPMITDCASSVATIEGLHRGRLLVTLKERSGEYLGIPVKTQ